MRSIEQIEAEIADLHKRWPAHTLKSTMIMRLEELEDELDDARRKEAVVDA